eukprot:756245-Prymnesium_polylepis.1
MLRERDRTLHGRLVKAEALAAWVQPDAVRSARLPPVEEDVGVAGDRRAVCAHLQLERSCLVRRALRCGFGGRGASRRGGRRLRLCLASQGRGRAAAPRLGLWRADRRELRGQV